MRYNELQHHQLDQQKRDAAPAKSDWYVVVGVYIVLGLATYGALMLFSKLFL